MVWLLAYFATGVAVLGGIFIDSRVGNSQKDGNFRNLMDQIRRSNRSWFEYIIEDVLLSLFTAIAVIAAWPIALIFAIYFYRTKHDNVPTIQDDMPKVFSVTREDLLHPQTVPQIEAKEVIYDPRGGVPYIPFGHLNKHWKTFLRASHPEDTLWSFESPWEQYGKKEQRYGYARVRENEVIDWFTKSIKPISSCISSS